MGLGVQNGMALHGFSLVVICQSGFFLIIKTWRNHGNWFATGPLFCPFLSLAAICLDILLDRGFILLATCILRSKGDKA